MCVCVTVCVLVAQWLAVRVGMASTKGYAGQPSLLNKPETNEKIHKLRGSLASLWVPPHYREKFSYFSEFVLGSFLPKASGIRPTCEEGVPLHTR